MATRQERAPAVGRGVPRVDPARAAPRLLDALASEHDHLSALLAVVLDLAGASTAALWQRDDRGRRLLVRTIGDAVVPATARRRPVGDGGDEGSVVEGVPLELSAPTESTYVARLHGSPFAAVDLSVGVLAVGPLSRDRLSQRDHKRLLALAAVVDGPLREALRRRTLEVERDSLRSELDHARRAIGTTIDEKRSLRLLIDLAVTTSGSSGGFVAVSRGDSFVIEVSRGLPAGFAALDVTPGHGMLGAVPGLPGLLVVEDPEALTALGLDGLVAVGGPAGSDQSTLMFGLVPHAGGELAPDCAELLALLVEQAGLVLASSEAARATTDKHVAALRGLCRALDARSPATRGHHPLVASVTERLAFRLDVDAEVRELAVAAALVHDAGLLAATAESPIAAEFAHAGLGAEMVTLVPGAAMLAPIIQSHHEWWDGFGFPSGLVGDAIPPAARILAAAELYVEMLQSPDPLDHRRIVDEVQARRGTQLDPRCADTLVALIEEDR